MQIQDIFHVLSNPWIFFKGCLLCNCHKYPNNPSEKHCLESKKILLKKNTLLPQCINDVLRLLDSDFRVCSIQFSDLETRNDCFLSKQNNPLVSGFLSGFLSDSLCQPPLTMLWWGFVFLGKLTYLFPLLSHEILISLVKCTYFFTRWLVCSLLVESSSFSL